MTNVDIIRAWKDEDYRNSLSEEQRALLPSNPAGMIELDDDQLADIDGGTTGLECITASIAVTALLTCSFNCATVFQGTCGAWTSGCCG